jgi:outer membrane protein TolC
MRKLKKVITTGLAVTAVFSASSAFAHGPIVLTLKDAVALAIRNNPTLEQAELTRITDKFALVVDEHKFEPNYTLTGSSSWSHTVSSGAASYGESYGVDAGVSLENHYGTQFTLDSNNSLSKYGIYNPQVSLEIIQPLIRGFGKPVVDAALDNAKDSEVVNRLNFKEAAITTVTTVINDYLSLVGDYQTYHVSQQSLKNYQRTVKNDEAMIAAGRTARSEIVQAQAKVASQQATLQSDLNSINTGKNTLLNDLGLPPGTDITLPAKFNFKKVEAEIGGGMQLSSLAKSQKIALSNSISYQTSLIAIRQARRNLLVAKDGQRWKLNLTAKETLGGGSGGGDNSNVESLYNGSNHSTSVGLALTIPIDDVSAQSTTLSAEVGLDKSIIGLKELKRSLIEQVETDYNTVLSEKKSLELSIKALALDKQTVYISEQKQLAGQVSTFQVLSDQQNLATEEQGLVTDEISYLQSIVTYQKELSTSLDPWHIKLRY